MFESWSLTYYPKFTFIFSNEDLDEKLYKYYYVKKLLSIKDKNKRMIKEFKILNLRLKVAKKFKEKKNRRRK